MKILLILLFTASLSFAQEVRQLYGASGSVAGTAVGNTLRTHALVGQPAVGTASGGQFGAGSGFGAFYGNTDILLDAPQGSPLLPDAFNFPQNYPNPFNPSTTLEFALPKDARVRLTIFDILGREVATLVDATLPAGFYVHHFQAPGTLASGLYFAVFDAGDFHKVRKLMLIK